MCTQVANGDVVRETFQVSSYYQITWLGSALAQLFMYGFCAVFVYCVLKTTTAINEQSYLLVRPLPEGATPGSCAEDLPDVSGGVDMGPVEHRLPQRVRRLLNAMQDVRNTVGALAPIVDAAAASMPVQRNGWLMLLRRVLAIVTCARRKHGEVAILPVHEEEAQMPDEPLSSNLPTRERRARTSTGIKGDDLKAALLPRDELRHGTTSASRSYGTSSTSTSPRAPNRPYRGITASTMRNPRVSPVLTSANSPLRSVIARTRPQDHADYEAGSIRPTDERGRPVRAVAMTPTPPPTSYMQTK
ncbi:MAG: hypothetical protein EOO65_02250 [Methanosarcinales archaeon]|nr:MAG: hypothetical protein EOO65_02250 [Methanosarcinales archaeon]